MSTNEEKLHKLKVAELKELLAKHHLVQTGKKDELVKRLVENNISADGDVAAEAHEEELVEAPADEEHAPAEATSAPAPTGENGSTKTDSVSAPTASEPSAPAELTPEQKALKARAERFGLPFDPTAPSKATAPASKPGKPSAAPSNGKASEATAAAPAAEKKEKPGPIDKTSLGLSDETLARRAAKFGLPEKKAEPTKAPNGAKPPTAQALKVADSEITPEMAEKIAAEEEKRRKRAQKFGTAAPAKHASEGSDAEPDAKKAKV